MNIVLQNNIMKQDMEYIKLILQTLADNESYFMMLETLANQLQEKTNEEQAFNDKFIGHFFLAKDANLIAEFGVCFFTGQQYPRPMLANGAKLRITAQGLEFLEALKNDTVFYKVKDFSLGVATDVGKKLLTAFLSKTLGID